MNGLDIKRKKKRLLETGTLFPFRRENICFLRNQEIIFIGAINIFTNSQKQHEM